MATDFKVYERGSAKLTASCCDATIAAVVVAQLGTDSVVKFGGRVVFKEGRDAFAGDSFDRAATIMIDRIDQHRSERARARLRALGSA